MSQNVPMHNLLRSQRSGRERPWGLWAVLTATVVVGIWWFAPWRALQTSPEAIEKSVVAATERARSAVAAARRPIEVRKGPKEETGRDPAWSATWTSGKATTLKGKLADNQSVYAALSQRGLPAASIQSMVTGFQKKFDFQRSRPGDIWTADVDSEGQITRFRYKKSPERIWKSVRNGDGSYDTKRVDVPIKRKLTTIAGVVSGSLWQSMMEAGESPKLIYRFADIFAYSIDFNRETQPGDQFVMVAEKVMLDGEFLRYGHIRAAEYVNKGEVFRGFRFNPEKSGSEAASDEKSESDSDASYFDAKGRNLKRQFLKSPLASVRVTSGYGQRYHPVLEKQKMHRGVDYGAPTGTPIRSVADGTVTFADWKGANGQLVVIDHANGYKTLYAHLSDIADGVHPGAKVQKKTIIGEVGSTGRSTGPHLHYGMTRHGEYMNPQNVDAARAEPLKGDLKATFQKKVARPMLDKLKEARLKAGLGVPDNQPLADNAGESGPDAGTSGSGSSTESRASAQTGGSPG